MRVVQVASFDVVANTAQNLLPELDPQGLSNIGQTFASSQLCRHFLLEAVRAFLQEQPHNQRCNHGVLWALWRSSWPLQPVVDLESWLGPEGLGGSKY